MFEVPFTNGHNAESPITQQRFYVKITKHSKAAFLTKSTSEFEAIPSTSDNTQVTEKVYSNRLGISFEDAKNIQRKLAKVLNLKPSSLFLDSISEGSVILTFCSQDMTLCL